MKKRNAFLYVIIFFAGIINQSLQATTEPLFSYTGSFICTGLRTSQHISIPVYYKGSAIPVEHNNYLITDTAKLSSLDIIITLLDIPQTNTIAHLAVPKNKPYTLLKLTRKQKQIALKKGEVFEELWNIITIKGTGPYKISKETLIIAVDPEMVDMITSNPWKRDGFITYLPTITFKKNFSSSDAYAQSLLQNLNVRSFHTKEAYFVTHNHLLKSSSSQRLLS